MTLCALTQYLLPILMKKLLFGFSLGVMFSSAAVAAIIQLDFGATGTPVTPGFTELNANFLSDTDPLTISNINGTGYNFSISHVASYNSGNTLEPLTTDGFYTFGNNANPHTFILSGLNPGDLVTLYAVAAWDGNGRGATIQFGASTTQAQTIGSPGSTPALLNFTQINAVPVVADAFGQVTGTLHGAGGIDSNTEGQTGAFVFDVTAVPEPGSACLFLVGAAGVFATRRKRRSETAPCR